MAKFLSRTLVSSIAVLLACYILDGVSVNSTFTAVLVAAVLGLLNSFVKPVLIILTIPITIFTLGLFLVVINILIVKLVADIVPGFRVDGWFYALLFSLIVSFITSILEGLIRNNEEERQ